MRCSLKILLFVLFCAVSLEASSLSMIEREESDRKIRLITTTFSDYFPIGYMATDKTGSKYPRSVFQDSFDNVFAKEKFKTEFISYPNSEEAISAVRVGNADVFFGMYYATDEYSGIEYVYPAALNNPVHLIMVPEKISKITNTDVLKSLRGIYSKQEYFSDFVIKHFKNLNMTPVETTDKAYEMLLTDQADYILGAYYYNYGQVLEKGLTGYLSFSKKSLWNMPLFIGLSKFLENKSAIALRIKNAVSMPEFKESVDKNLRKMIQELEEQTQGTVPPKYVRTPIEGELTPADEPLKGENP